MDFAATERLVAKVNAKVEREGCRLAPAALKVDAPHVVIGGKKGRPGRIRPNFHRAGEAMRTGCGACSRDIILRPHNSSRLADDDLAPLLGLELLESSEQQGEIATALLEQFCAGSTNLVDDLVLSHGS